MQSSHQSFYQPYESESDDSSSISSTSTNTRGEIDTKALGAINLDDPAKQISERIQPRSRNGVEYSSFDLSGNYDKSLPYSETTFDKSAATYTSILMINSLDRDRQVYVQPTFLTLRLPRTYRNVTSFQITQMKLLSSFFYFRPDKANTTLTILEQGRTIMKNGETVDNVITVTIRTGTYTIDTLLTELQTQLNRTPLFFYFPNGITDFITQFTATGDLSVNFNQPGDTYYNSLTDQFISNPTMSTIVNTYFASQYAGLTTYTLAQIKVAYYYPVLYEALLDPDYENKVNLTLTTATLLPGETVRSRIIYTFQGLNDLVAQDVITTNLALLDIYRSFHTFVYSLVDEYSCTYEQNNNRIIISTNRLNTSLYTLINAQTTKALANQLNQRGLSVADYSNLVTGNSRYTAVFTDMYNTMQRIFASNFAVNFGTYSPTFFTNLTNAPYLQNGIGVTGVATGYSLALLQSGTEAINSSTQGLQSSAGYWPQVKSQTDTSNNVLFVGSGLGTRQQDISATVMNVPYNTQGQTILTGTKMIDNSGNLYINPTFQAGDCVTPILSSKYTVFRFRSLVRQTLQVETLPVPYYYRFPTVNKLNFDYTIQTYFDLSYSYVNVPTLTRSDISNVVFNYGNPYTTSITLAKDFNLTVQTPVRYYSFIAPTPQDPITHIPLTDCSGYKYPLTISVVADTILGQVTTFNSQLNVFFYHDQGAFYADISGYRNENPYNYKGAYQSVSDASGIYINTNVVAGNTYYLIVRSTNVSFQNTRFKVIAYYPQQYDTPFARYYFDQSINPYNSTPTISFPVTTDISYNQLYAFEYDTDFIRLPTAKNLQGNDPSSQSFNQYLPTQEVPIGYDISGVSTDLTDYRGYYPTQSNVTGNIPFVSIRADPINHFSFQNVTGYNPNVSKYIYTNSSNAILNPISNLPYTAKTVNARQYKIVHWYDQQYIPPQKGQPGIPSKSFVAKSSVLDASYGLLTGFTYDSPGNPTTGGAGPQTGLTLGEGVMGIGFLPSESVWDIDQIVFKSAYTERPGLTSNFTDPNRSIVSLGVFPTTYVTGSQLSAISLNDAMVKLTLRSTIIYSPDIQLIYGGFDTVGGTYYQYSKDTTFTTTNKTKLSGYTPSVQYLFDSNSYYSVVPFDSAGAVATFYTLMGSYVPYPTSTRPISTAAYNSPTGIITTPDGKGFYYPSALVAYNPKTYYFPTDSNIFQSRYEQSIPMKTNLLHTQNPTDPISFSNGYYYYSSAAGRGQGGFGTPFANTLLSKEYYLFTINAGMQSNIPGIQTISYYVTSNRNTTTNNSGVDERLVNIVTSASINNISYPDGWSSSWSNGFVGITSRNTTMTSPTDNIYVLTAGKRTIYTEPYTKGPEFVFSQFNLLTGRLTPLIPATSSGGGIRCGNIISNASILNKGSPSFPWQINDFFGPSVDGGGWTFLHSTYCKLFYTLSGLVMFQTQLTNLPPQNQTPSSNNLSFFGVYNSNINAITNFFPMSGVPTGSNGPRLQLLFGTGYFWDPQNYSNPTQTNTTLDWTADQNGNIYVLNSVTPNTNTYFSISRYTMSNTGRINFTTPLTFYATTAQNPSVYSGYGLGLFNYIKVDLHSNVFLAQMVPSGANPVTSGSTSAGFTNTPYLNSNFSIPLLGKYAKVAYGEYSNGGNVPFSVNAQTFNATVLDTGYAQGFPLIGSQLILGTRSNMPSSFQPLFTQVSTRQGFLFNRFDISIVDYQFKASSMRQSDISGSYTLSLSGPAGVFQVLLFPMYTQSQIQATFITAIGTASINISIGNTTFTVGGREELVGLEGTLTYSIFTTPGYTVATGTNALYHIPTPSIPFPGPVSLGCAVTVPGSYSVMSNNPLWGNSEYGVDLLSPTTSNVWQVMYPTVKFVMRKVKNGSTPITDTTDLVSSAYPSYSHTAMFYYDNYSDLSNDLFNKFGQESKSRFKAYDVSSGYEFKSYIYNIPLEAYKGSTQDISSNKGYNYLAVRAYSPAEQFNCLTRFYLPGRYDFGFIKLQDLSNETQTVLVDLSGSSTVNPTYATVLNAFNNAFKGSFTFGANSVPGFPGSNYTFTGFGSFLAQYNTIYNTGSANSQLLADINSGVQSNVAAYINTYLSTILPSYVLSRSRFTDPLLFSILFKTALTDVTLQLDDEWGLGWNLGYPKQDTPFDTIQRATSFFKILDDYIYLRMNQEFTMNRMDTSGKENLSITHDTTGQINRYAGKLLLANFGNYAQTMVQNTVNFAPPLTSLDKLTFQWVDITNTQINNADCEWNAVVQINEEVAQPPPIRSTRASKP